MALTYHQRTFDLIGVTPRLSPQANFWLDQVEREHGLTLPPSLRELYSVVCARELLLGAMWGFERRRIRFLTVPLDHLLTRAVSPYLNIALNDRTSLVYSVQPAITANDPPVYSNYWSNLPAAQVIRDVHTATLSEFLYWFTWDHLAAHYSVQFHFTDTTLRPWWVRSLEKHFNALPASRTTTEVTHRFTRDNTNLRLTATIYSGFAFNPSLYVHGGTATTFRAVVRDLLSLGSFWAGYEPHNRESARILETVVT